MSDHPLRPRIEALWERRATLTAAAAGEPREAVEAALDLLDRGELRVAQPGPEGWPGGWVVHEWLKKAVLLSFRLNDSAPMPGKSPRNGIFSIVRRSLSSSSPPSA